MTCVHVCPYMAPQINEFNKAEVQGATCMGCGSCTAECPAKAIHAAALVDNQILAAIDGMLGENEEEKNSGIVIPGPSGVAPPRWHLT